MRNQLKKRERIQALEQQLAELQAVSRAYLDATAQCCPAPRDVVGSARVLKAYDLLKAALNITQQS